MNFSINGIEWSVEYVDYPNGKLRRVGKDYPHGSFDSVEDEYAYGVTDTESKVVSIANNLIPSLSKKVLCHEIVHCAMYSYGVELTIEQEELVADLIATYGEEIIDITNDIFSRIKKGVA